MLSLIIGLGNPGIRYAETRHNLGYDLLDKLARLWKARPKPGLGDYNFAEHDFEGSKIYLVWPTTYMNNSGSAAIQAMVRFGLKPADILTLYDDLALPMGNIRIRTKGSDGGHNGMMSMIASLGTEELVRLRMGIGEPPEDVDPEIYVLGRFSEKEYEIRKKMLGKATESVLYLLKNRPEEAMSKYNNNPAPEND